MSETIETHEDPQAEYDPAVVTVAAPNGAPRIAKPPRPDRDRDRSGLSQTQREMETEDQVGIREWMNSLAGESPLRCAIIRMRPKVGPNGENIAGTVETVEEKIDEDYIREMHGGGTYQLKVARPNASGSWVYFKGKTIQIAGPPRENGVVMEQRSARGGEETPLAAMAVNAYQETSRRERERADRLEREAREAREGGRGGMDIDALRAITEPVYAQLQAAQQAAARAQAAAIEASNRPPATDPFRDKLMERLISDESARVAALRAQFESEMRQREENHRDQLKRLEDRHDRDIDTLEKRAQREIDMAMRMASSEGKARDIATEARIDALKSENTRLERELGEARARIGALDAVKNQSIFDKAEEVKKLKEAFGGDGDGDGDAPAWYEKLAGALGNAPVLMHALDKITGSGGQPAQQSAPQPQLPPPHHPFRGQDGNVYIHDGQGNVRQIDPGVLRQRLALAAARKRRKGAGMPMGPATEGEAAAPGQDAAGEAPAAPTAPPPPPMRRPDAGEVRLAVQFMESAISNNSTPEVFAASSRSMIPTDILAYIQHVGIDDFLNKVAKLEVGSPLTTQRGRNFARAVARVLLEGTSEPPPA